MCSPLARHRDATGEALSVRHAMPPPYRGGRWRRGGTRSRGRMTVSGISFDVVGRNAESSPFLVETLRDS